MGILKLFVRFPMWGIALLLFLAVAVTALVSASPAKAGTYGCGYTQWGQYVCGRVEPTCEQAPRPGCPNWGNWHGGWNNWNNNYQQPRRQQYCWWEWQWGQRVQHCEWR